jgi:hypothetical protein
VTLRVLSVVAVAIAFAVVAVLLADTIHIMRHADWHLDHFPDIVRMGWPGSGSAS